MIIIFLIKKAPNWCFFLRARFCVWSAWTPSVMTGFTWIHFRRCFTFSTARFCAFRSTRHVTSFCVWNIRFIVNTTYIASIFCFSTKHKFSFYVVSYTCSMCKFDNIIQKRTPYILGVLYNNLHNILLNWNNIVINRLTTKHNWNINWWMLFLYLSNKASSIFFCYAFTIEKGYIARIFTNYFRYQI